MNKADVVRDHCWRVYIEPARRRGDRYVGIRAGDVAKDLKFSNSYPLVCAAMGANTFQEAYGVERVSVVGPLNGVNTTFWFKLDPGEVASGDPSSGSQRFVLMTICPQCGAVSERPA